MERKLKIGITGYPVYGGSGVVATELGIELAVSHVGSGAGLLDDSEGADDGCLIAGFHRQVGVLPVAANAEALEIRALTLHLLLGSYWRNVDRFVVPTLVVDARRMSSPCLESALAEVSSINRNLGFRCCKDVGTPTAP